MARAMISHEIAARRPAEELQAAPTVLHRPGHLFGPCAHSCRHVECLQLRAQAAKVCRYCRTPIGTGWPYCQDPRRDFSKDPELVHLACYRASGEAPGGRPYNSG